MARPFRRAGELASNLRFTVSFVARALAEDPLWLAVQAARRAPERVRWPLVRVLGARNAETYLRIYQGCLGVTA